MLALLNKVNALGKTTVCPVSSKGIIWPGPQKPDEFWILEPENFMESQLQQRAALLKQNDIMTPIAKHLSLICSFIFSFPIDHRMRKCYDSSVQWSRVCCAGSKNTCLVPRRLCTTFRVRLRKATHIPNDEISF